MRAPASVFEELSLISFLRLRGHFLRFKFFSFCYLLEVILPVAGVSACTRSCLYGHFVTSSSMYWQYGDLHGLGNSMSAPNWCSFSPCTHINPCHLSSPVLFTESIHHDLCVVVSSAELVYYPSIHNVPGSNPAVVIKWRYNKSPVSIMITSNLKKGIM
jgi:hypothetical protein